MLSTAELIELHDLVWVLLTERRGDPRTQRLYELTGKLPRPARRMHTAAGERRYSYNKKDYMRDYMREYRARKREQVQ